LAALQAAIEYFDDPPSRHSLGDDISLFDNPCEDPGHNAVVGRDWGGIVAYAWDHIRGGELGHPKVWLEGGVHPAWRHRRIGHALVTWQLARARACYAELSAGNGQMAPLWVGCAVDAHSGVVGLLADAGFTPERWLLDLQVQFEQTAPPDDPRSVEGIVLKRFLSEWSEAVRDAHNEAFSTEPGAQPVDRESWEASIDRPEWCWMALDGDRVVGYAMNSELRQEWAAGDGPIGWTDRLGVRPAYRKRGIATALLQASIRSFADAGMAGAGIGVDPREPERLLRTLEPLGYVPKETVVLYSRTFA